VGEGPAFEGRTVGLLCARALGMTHVDCAGRSSSIGQRATGSAGAGRRCRTIARMGSTWLKAAPAVVAPSGVMTIWLCSS